MSTNKFWNGIGQAHEFAQAFEMAGGTEADITVFIQNKEKMEDLILLARGEGSMVSKILGQVRATIALNALAEPFVAKDHFVLNTSDDIKVKIGHIEGYFCQLFRRQVIAPREGYDVSLRSIVQPAFDIKISQELGNKCNVDIASVFQMMSLQPNGGPGLLLVNGFSNIFFCIDIFNNLRPVAIVWENEQGSWSVYTLEDNRYSWSKGNQVISRV